VYAITALVRVPLRLPKTVKLSHGTSRKLSLPLSVSRQYLGHLTMAWHYNEHMAQS
jgi:hypothetical protein